MFEEHGIYLGSIAFKAIEDVVKVYIQQELEKERLQIIGKCSDREEWLRRKVAELERKLEQTGKDLADSHYNYPTIKELEKENKELQGKVDMLQGYLDHDIEYDIEQKNKELEKQNNELEKRCNELFFQVNEQVEQIEKMKSDTKTAYIKGIRTMANALKKYDREEGAWTDYFEHTVDKVLKNLLNE